MKKFLIVITCIAIFVGGWLLYARAVLPAFDKKVNEFHEKYNERDFEYIYGTLVSQEFKRALPYKIFSDYMDKVYSTVGKVLESERGGWGVFYKDIGLTFNAEYDIQNERGELLEKFTFIKRGKDWLIFVYDPRMKS